jgi:hypothetical protein
VTRSRPTRAWPSARLEAAPSPATSSCWRGSRTCTSATPSAPATSPRRSSASPSTSPPSPCASRSTPRPWRPRGQAGPVQQDPRAAVQGDPAQRGHPGRGDRGPGELPGQGQGRVPDGHPGRDHAREGFELTVGRPEVILKHVGRQGPGADGAPVHRLRGAVHGHRHREALAAQGTDDQPGQQRFGQDPGRVLHPVAGAHRLPRRVPDRHQGHGHHELLRSTGYDEHRGEFPSASPARWSPTARALPWPTPCSTSSPGASSSSSPATRSTRA